MHLSRIEQRERRLSGVFVPPDPSFKWWKRLVFNPWLYTVLATTALAAFLLWDLYRTESANMLYQIQQLTEGKNGLNEAQVFEAMRHGLVLAWPTAAVYVLFFVLIDRWRPMPWYLKYISLVWGGAVAIYVSFFVNSWASTLLTQMASLDDPLASSRGAPFSAPFVEELMKAIIVIILAILARHRVISVLQAICLSGISAIGFAFIENIVYYYRSYVLLSIHPALPDIDAEMHNLVMLRGVITSFCHPLFTSFTAIGIVVMLNARSKLVRIVAPLAGFGFAALGHMLYNGYVSIFTSTNDGQIRQMLYFVLIFVASSLVSYIFRGLIKQGKLITFRALDYAQMGWLTPRDVLVFNNLFRRWKLMLASLFRGRKTIVATRKMIFAVTDLCYLRDRIDRGLVGRGGAERERELVDQIRDLRGVGLDEPYKLKIIPRPIFGKIRAAYRSWRENRRLRRAQTRLRRGIIPSPGYLQ